MYKEYKKDSTWRFNQPNGTLRFKLNWNNGEFANGTTYLTKAEKDEYTADSINYDIIEQPAQFIGGMSAFYSYVNRSIKYPQKAIDIGIEGRVILTFVINLKGHIEDIQVTRKIHPLLDAEAVRIVTNNQKWMPAIQKGLKVRQKTQLPITFKLQ